MKLLIQFSVAVLVGVVLSRCAMAQSDENPVESKQQFILVKGAGGEKEYDELFRTWLDRWKLFAEKKSQRVKVIGTEENSGISDRETFINAISELKEAPDESTWIVLIGHGTFDGKQAKFNIRGRDLTADDFKEQLASVPGKCVIVGCFSCSGAFVPSLSAKNRTVIASTRNGYEFNFSRFGEYLSQLISDSTIDLDKDGETSLLEAFLVASKQTNEFYTSDARIITEHPVIDDNGDGVGTPADSFQGIRSKQKAKNGLAKEGTFANQMMIATSGSNGIVLTDEQRKHRRAVESEIEKLREKKTTMKPDAYLIKLESLVLRLASTMRGTETDQKRN